MARINIEDCWWTDPRRSMLIRLVGDEDRADGIAVRMWRLAQEFWGHGRKLVPFEIFETIEASAKLIQAKLATVEGDHVYVRGSSQYHDWHFERREAARSGGKKSAQRPRNAKGQLQKVPKKSKQKPTKPILSGSVSDSGSDFGSSSVSDFDKLPISEKSATGFNPVKYYCDLWIEKNGKSPDIRPKEAGQLTKFAKDLGAERSQELMRAYFSMPDPLFMKRGYDVGTMILSINAISQFEVHGKIVTSEAVKQIEKQVDKIQGTKRRRSIEELEAEREAQREVVFIKGGNNEA